MNKLRKFDLASWCHLLILVLTVALFAVVQALPLLSTLGFESANVFVTVFGPLFFLAASLNNKNKFNSFGHIMSREALWLIVHLGFFVGLLFANGFFRTSCSESSGLLPFLVIACPPLLLNVSLGVLSATLVRKIWIKVLIFLVAFPFYYAAILFSWWQDPTFRVLTHASLLISSDLLTGAYLTAAVAGFRAATLLLALSIIWFGVSMLGNNSPRMFKKSNDRPVLSVMIIATLFAFHLILEAKSVEAIGKNRSTLTKDYELFAEQDGLRIFANPLKITQKHAYQIFDEARFYHQQIRDQIPELSSAPITIWLHDSEQEKFLYTGAKNVHFALPKHREIHISGTEIPHGVLGHELAHIYVGEHSQTIFGVPGILQVIPNIALTEGIAVYLTQELNVDNGLSILEQARALYQAQIRMNVVQLFSNNPFYFISSHPRAAYIYSGATVAFLLEQVDPSERKARLQEVIRFGSLAPLFANENEMSLSLANFKKKLAEPMPPHAISWAKEKFPKSSILTSDCGEKARHDQWHLQRAILNQDFVPIKSIAEQLSPAERIRLLNNMAKQLLTQAAYKPALEAYQLEESLLTEAEDLAQVRFNIVDSLINLDHFDRAATILPTIDEQYFFASQRRLLQIARILLHNYSQGNEHRELSRTTLKFLFAKSQDIPMRLAELSYARGKDFAITAETDSIVDMIALYVQARFYLRMDLLSEARPMISQLYHRRTVFPDLIAREVHSMWATTLEKLREYPAALPIFSELWKTAITDGEKIYFQDQIDRVNFHMRH